MKDTWEKVGTIGVDAGLCWIGDPCYIIHSTDEKPDLGKDWGEFCSRLYPPEEGHHDDGVRQWNYGLGHAGLGVTVGTGWGDGTYDVLVQRKHGRVMRVMVEFDPPEEDESDDSCYDCGEPYEYCECDYPMEDEDDDGEDCS